MLTWRGRLRALPGGLGFGERRDGFLFTGVCHKYFVQPGAPQQLCHVLSRIDQPNLAFLAARPGEEAHEPSQADAVDVVLSPSDLEQFYAPPLRVS